MEVVKHLRQTGHWMSRAVRVVLSRLASLLTGGAAGLRCSRLTCASFTLDSPIHALKGMLPFGRR